MESEGQEIETNPIKTLTQKPAYAAKSTKYNPYIKQLYINPSNHSYLIRLYIYTYPITSDIHFKYKKKSVTNTIELIYSEFILILFIISTFQELNFTRCTTLLFPLILTS